MFKYQYPRPSVTADSIVLRYNNATQGVEVLLIQRRDNPFKNRWAFPGGFVNKDEDLLAAVHRELKEETKLTGVCFTPLPPVGTPNRDPRGHVITCPFIAGIKFTKSNKLKAMDDAKALKWYDLKELPNLAFDHHTILINAISQARYSILPQMLNSKASDYESALAMRSILKAIVDYKPQTKNV